MTDLRRADAADAPALHRIASAAYSPYLPRMGGQRPGPLDADYAAAVEECETWLALLDGSPVGFVVLAGEGSDVLVLENVAVLPSHRGRGIGRALLELAEARAATRGCTRIRLFTHVTMVENQALYERIGYLRTHHATDDGVTLVFYEKVL
ncbi:GNAT family N-acetyltransferase [Nocardioides sp. GCM10028917]|uniref:GNAT family N-acetyltransferase n=1 Tax=Nocardioides sp. GCM10028917 TaxID=3273408 RepID=UPI00360820CF